MVSGMELVRQAAIGRLRDRGIRAESAYGREWAGEYREPVIVVGVRSCAAKAAGLGHYLGREWDAAAGTEREVYGWQARLTLALDAYAPREAGAKGCLAALEAAHDALTGEPIAGLRPGSLEMGEAEFDRDTGMFVQRGSLQCAARFVAAAEEETGVLLDFRLKGVPWIEQSDS